MYEVADSDDEKYLAVSCLLQDLAQSRSYVQETWSQYNSNSIDLLSASISKNAALELIRRLTEDLMNRYSECTDYKALMRSAYFSAKNSQAIKHHDGNLEGLVLSLMAC